MKRWKLLLSFLLIFIFIGSPGLAAKANNRIMVGINGSNFVVTETPVLVDGQAIKTDAPSYINNDNLTFVPIRFVESYGAKVGWDQKTKTATITQSGKEIKMTIDSRDIYINGKKKVIDQKFVPKLVTFTINGRKDGKTMIPFRLISETLGYEVGYDKVKRVPYINTPKPEVPKEETPSIEPPKPEPPKEEDLSHLNRVKAIEKEWINGKESIVIYNTENVSINTMKFNNPERIVVDIKDSLLEGGTYFTYPYELGFIKGIRVSQFSPDNNYKPDDKIVRVVLDIKDGVKDPEIKIDNDRNRIIITPKTSIWQILDYSMKGTNRTVSINANTSTEYSVDYDSYLKTMTISLPAGNLDLTEGKIDINDGLIKDISIREVRGEAYITVSFIRSAEYTILSRPTDDKITLSLRRDTNIKSSDRVIVIDPGHGGSDPGAVQNGVREKDVNFPISLKLNKVLQDKGYNTIMTRYDDSALSLYDRAKVANEVQADLFISIHANSNDNSSITGIQVLYHSKDKANVKKEETLALAQIMMDEITKGTGAQNRGLLARERTVVIRDTNMPSVLIETGFLTNSEEAKLLQTEEYQNLMVESIIKGIERYFEIY